MSEFNIENIPFDQYQRYSIVVEIIKSCSCHSKIKVLEVGSNAHGNLKKFLPNATIVSIDTEASDELLSSEDFYLGSGSNLPFDDNSFDFVVSLDVLEHVPLNERNAFIKESFRVSSIGVVAAFPMDSKKTTSSEKIVNDIWRKYFGEDYRWLKEHSENSLPLKNDVAYIAKSITPHSFIFGHGSLGNWEALMKLHFLAEKTSDLSDLVQCIDRFYNMEICGSDVGEDNYRHFLVLMRQQEDVQKANEIYDRLNSGVTNSNFTLLASELANISESLVMLNEQLEEKDSNIKLIGNQLEAAEHQRNAAEHQRNAAENKLSEILSSRSWKITYPLRFIKKFFS